MAVSFWRALFAAEWREVASASKAREQSAFRFAKRFEVYGIILTLVAFGFDYQARTEETLLT